MKPEERNRKKVEAFDPHPPGTKHQMMAARSRKVKDGKQKVENKTKNRDRMKLVRQKEKGNKTTQKERKFRIRNYRRRRKLLDFCLNFEYQNQPFW